MESPTSTETAPSAANADVFVPVSTEITAGALAKIDAHRARDDRSRAYVLRRIVHDWAAKQPTPKQAKKA